MTSVKAPDPNSVSPAGASPRATGVWPPTLPTHAVSRQWMIDAVAAGVIATLAWLLFRHGYLGYDAAYALSWGRELADGVLPDYGIPDAPTPHPLANALSGLASLLGDATAYDLMVALSYLSFGVVVWSMFRLGQCIFSTGAGIVAVLVLGTSFIVLSRTLASFLDIPFLALVLVAALLEIRRPRRGFAVLAVLAVAGLLRPEGWGLAAAYWVYLWPHLDWQRRVGLAALGAAPAGIWALGDLVVMGDPLFSLTGARETAATVGFAEVTDRQVARDAAEDLRDILRAPALAGGVAGLAAAVLFDRRRAGLPIALLAVATALFGVQVIADVPVTDRMLFVPAAMLALFCGFAAFGWRAQEHGGMRKAWAGGGVALLAVLAITAPNQMDRLDRLDGLVGDLDASIEGLGALTRTPEFDLGRCSPLSAPNHRLAPYVAHFVDISPAHLTSAAVQSPSRGLFLAPATPGAASLLRNDSGAAPRRTDPPAGFEPVASNRSWRLYERGC